MTGLNNLDETYTEYLLAPTNDLVRQCRSKVKVTAGRRGGKGIHINTGPSSPSSSCMGSRHVTTRWSWWPVSQVLGCLPASVSPITPVCLGLRLERYNSNTGIKPAVLWAVVACVA